MFENELEVGELATGPKIVCALVRDPCVHRLVAPAPDDIERVPVSGLIAQVQEALRQPCATHLVFLAKFTAAAGSNQRDRGKAGRKVLRGRRMVAQTGDIGGIASCSLLAKRGARRRQQDKRPL